MAFSLTKGINFRERPFEKSLMLGGESMNKYKKDNLKNKEFFKQNLAAYGQKVEALNWGSRQSQQQRFRVLVEVGIRSGYSLLDVGCGLADFKHWLDTQGIEVRYSGLDITPEMIKKCRQRYPEQEFFCGDIFDSTPKVFDYAVASGIFYLRQHQPLNYLLDTVAAMFEKVNYAIAFNSLSSWAHKRDATEFYADPLAVVKACRELSEHIVLRHDYHPRDFTVYLYKP